MKKVFLVLLLVLGGCTTGEKMKWMSAGMNKEEVISLLGKPNGYRKIGKAEHLQYTNKKISGWGHDTADYNVVLEDGIVTGYGAGEVRVKEGTAQTLFIVPLP